MPRLGRVPCPPGEDYDHLHSVSAALGSLSVLLEAFDAAMDSVESSVAECADRVTVLSRRISVQKLRIHEATARASTTATATANDNDNDVMSLRLPATLPLIPSESATSDTPSAMDRAREAAWVASSAELHRQWCAIDDNDIASQIRPSDAWLDRVSPFDETALCAAAERMHTVPSLFVRPAPRPKPVSSTTMTPEEYLRHAKAEAYDPASRMAEAKTSILTQKWDEDDIGLWNVSAATAADHNNAGMDMDDRSILTSSTLYTTRSHTQIQTTTLVGVGAPTSSSSTQETTHAATGSHPYLCELLHDAHGIGLRPDTTIFPSPSTTAELFYRPSTLTASKESSREQEHGDNENDGNGHGHRQYDRDDLLQECYGVVDSSATIMNTNTNTTTLSTSHNNTTLYDDFGRDRDRPLPVVKDDEDEDRSQEKNQNIYKDHPNPNNNVIENGSNPQQKKGFSTTTTLTENSLTESLFLSNQSAPTPTLSMPRDVSSLDLPLNPTDIKGNGNYIDIDNDSQDFNPTSNVVDKSLSPFDYPTKETSDGDVQ